jgi:GT2 family glycosyltransferase
MDDSFAVVVTWNGEDCIAKCLRSLRGSDVPVRVVVVDNASTDRTLEIVRHVCPEATVFRLRRNLGFGRANNIGLSHACDQGSEHILLINQDAYVEPDVIGGLVNLQRLHPEYGILSPLHLDGAGTNLDRLFCEHLSKASSGRQLLSDALLNRHLADVYDVAFINAAVWLLSRECIERVGLFNPAFEHYGEDKEYADRVHFHGLRIGLAPGLRAFHKRVQAKPKESVTLERYLIQESAIVRYRLSRQTPSTPFNVLSALSRIMLSRHPGDGSHLTSIRVKATLLRTLFSCLPTMLRMKRIAYQGGRRFFQDAEYDKGCYLLVGTQADHESIP